MKAWAWSEGVSNFGDELGLVILQKLGYEIDRVSEIADADILASGSLLEHASEHAKEGAIIWGGGLMHGYPVSLERMDVRAVRGRLSATACGLGDLPLGDPGELVPHLWDRPVQRRDFGIVRHYVDDADYHWGVPEISAGCPVDEVIDFIGSCKSIASSSLHGLIVASSWGIPAARLHHDGVAGGNFKWADWASGSGSPKKLLEVLP